jgi:hypothetical protein
MPTKINFKSTNQKRFVTLSVEPIRVGEVVYVLGTEHYKCDPGMIELFEFATEKAALAGEKLLNDESESLGTDYDLKSTHW